MFCYKILIIREWVRNIEKEKKREGGKISFLLYFRDIITTSII